MLHIYRGPDVIQVHALAEKASKHMNVAWVKDDADAAHDHLMNHHDVIVSGEFAKYWTLNRLIFEAIMYNHPAIITEVVGGSEKVFESNNILEKDFPFEWIVWNQHHEKFNDS